MSAGSNPFAPGDSPFHTKGTIWMGIRDFVEARVLGGIPAVAGKLERPLRDFFEQTFFASTWYDLLPITPIAGSVAAIMGVDPAEYVRQSAAFQAERDMAGVYKPLLASDTPEAVCKRFASIFSQLYDFGKTGIVKEEAKRMEALAQGLPEPIAWWWMHGTEAYLQPVLRAAGAHHPRIMYGAPEPDGNRAGVALVRIRSHTVWS